VVERFLIRGDMEEGRQFAGFVRRIWLRRNEFIHGGSLSHPIEIVTRTKEAMEEFQTSNVGIAMSREMKATETWTAPGWYKANWDAAIDRVKGWMGLGVILCGHILGKSHIAWVLR
jgi:hypothetical protein